MTAPRPRAGLVLAAVAATLTAGSAVAVVPAGAHEPDVQVAAVVRDATGRLAVRTRTAGSLAEGRALAGAWDAQPGVVAADVEHVVQASAYDPYRGDQWGLTRLGAERTWTRTTGTGVVVAVLDTGVQADHPDLAGQVLPLVDVLDPRATGSPATDPEGHGTHVAGIIAALAGNGLGGAGLAPGARVLPVRVLAADGTGRDSDVAEGVLRAVDAHADVLNLSLGGSTRSPVLSAAIGYAVRSGVVVVAAAGNDGAGANPVEYPAAEPGVLGVGAVDRADQHATFSATGSFVDLVAPGVRVLSTLSGSGYGWGSGTSMAAPFVAAAAAQLVAAGVPRASVADRLLAAAQDLGVPGRDPVYGAGMVDVEDALPLPVDPVPVPVAAPAPGAAPVVGGTVSEPAPVTAPAVEPAAPSASVVRLSASARAVAAGSPVTVSARVLRGGSPLAGAPVTLERLVGGAWTTLRTTRGDASGLVSWTLRPDAGTDLRAVSSGTASAGTHVDVVQRLTASASRAGATGAVAPAGRSAVALQRRAGSSWATVTRVTSAADGRFRLAARLGAGTVVRLVVTARPGLLGTQSVAVALR